MNFYITVPKNNCPTMKCRNAIVLGQMVPLPLFSRSSACSSIFPTYASDVGISPSLSIASTSLGPSMLSSLNVLHRLSGSGGGAFRWFQFVPACLSLRLCPPCSQVLLERIGKTGGFRIIDSSRSYEAHRTLTLPSVMPEEPASQEMMNSSSRGPFQT